MNNGHAITQPRPGLYLCRRTSSWDEKPCDEAFPVLLVNVDTRDCDDPKKIPAHRGTNGDWYERGTNHRVEGGKIHRDLGTVTRWAIELTDIQSFVDRYGPCIVFERNLAGFCQIEIYDDWRE